MTESTFRVVFSGNILPGTDRDTAIANFARLLKRTPEQVAGAFGGKPSVLKKGISEAEAARYRQALEKAGLQVTCEAEQPVAEKPSLALSLVDPDAAPVAVAAPREDKPVVAPPKIRESLALVVDEEHREEETSPAASAGAANEMTCPACGLQQAKADICSGCGVVVAKFLQRKGSRTTQGNDDPQADSPAGDEAAGDSSGIVGKLRGFVDRILKRDSGRA